jgi:hypothetical protein
MPRFGALRDKPFRLEFAKPFAYRPLRAAEPVGKGFVLDDAPLLHAVKVADLSE